MRRGVPLRFLYASMACAGRPLPSLLPLATYPNALYILQSKCHLTNGKKNPITITFQKNVKVQIIEWPFANSITLVMKSNYFITGICRRE
jgi:hypothetical protein